MKLWDITLTCDHKLLVVAATVEQAVTHATEAARHHDPTARVSPLPGEEPVEVTLTEGVLVWYPGPFSDDAIVDMDDEITREGRAMAAGGLI